MSSSHTGDSQLGGPGGKVYSALMFVAVSVLAGLLTAGLIVPFAALAGLGGQAAAASMESLPAELSTPPMSQKSTVYLANGKTLAVFADENRTYVPLSKISPVMQLAQIAIEDHRFYEHGALDIKGTLRALVRNSAGGSTQGGSTLTQQYVKQVRVEAAMARGDDAGAQRAQEASFQRKIQEARYALALERKYSKDQILERYLNIAYYGDGAYGVEAAARHYFNTSAAKLTLGQAALIAGIVQNPAALDPVNNRKESLSRRNVVLARIAFLHPELKAQAQAAMKQGFDSSKVHYQQKGCAASPYPHLCQYVRNYLINTPSGLGKTAKERESRLQRGGLAIQTEIDPATQDAAERAISNYISSKDPVISTMVMVEPGTGLITAMAQSRPKQGTKAGETYYNYAVDQTMGGAEGYQAGSTFKAFTIAAALKSGIPATKVYRAPSRLDVTGQTFKACDGRTFASPRYAPANSTRSNPNGMNMYEAAKWSVNTYFIQLERDAGICTTTRIADALGVQRGDGGTNLTKDFQWVPSFTLGPVEVTPLSMANAYATFAARGVHCDPSIVKSVKLSNGKDVALPERTCKQVIPQEVADGVNKVLQGVMNGTGAPATIPGGYPQAGKTGTTDAHKAVWFCGYTPQMAGCSMIAIDKTNPWWASGWRKKSLKNLRLPASGHYLAGSGGGDAGNKIYRPAMTAALKGKPRTGFHDAPSSVLNGKRVQVPSCSGMSVDSCTTALEGNEFTVRRLYQYSPYAAGTLLWVSPSGSAMQGATITLGVSRGPAPTRATTTKTVPEKKPAEKKPAEKKPAAKKSSGKKKP